MAALVDPTGLYAVAVQRLADVLEEEIHKVVSFRNTFEGLLEDLTRWKPTLEGLADVSDNDPAVNSWLKSLKEWMEKSKSLVQDCQAVEQGCTCSSLFHICRKRKLSECIVNIRQEFKNIMEQVQVLLLRKQLPVSAVVQRALTLPNREPKSYLKQVIPDQLVSMEKQLEDILRMLISPASNNKWVGVWGQGGSGKTIIAKQINNSDVVEKFFLGQIFFVVVGGATNSPRNLLRELCRLLKSEFSEEDHIDKLQSVLYTALRGKRVLLILDDVWDYTFLEALDVVDGSEGSRIFVTTRNRELLDRKHAQVFSAGLMQREASTRLFYNHAFGVGQDCPQSVTECAGEIIEICKDLPLALAIVGSAMARKTGVRQWSYEAQKIKEKYFLGEERMRGLFQYSYDQLKRVEQECFLTMLSWPEDSRIRPLMLVPWWRGEDLIRPLSENGWEQAEEILEALVSRSLILQNSRGKGSSMSAIHWFRSDQVSDLVYQIHDVILELGLDHLLKHESELQEHEQGHIFLSSLKHRQKFIECARSDQTKLSKVRKISFLSKEDLQFEEHVSQALRTSDFPHLKTMIWTPIRSELICEAIAGAVSKTSSVLKVLMLRMEGLKPLAIEVSSGDLQTLDFTVPLDLRGGTYTFTTLPPNLRWLRLATTGYTGQLPVLESNRVVLGRPEHLKNLEVLKCNWPKVLNVLHFDFKKLSCLVLEGAERRIVVPSLDISNIRVLDVRDCANVEPSGSGAAHLPKLERLNTRGDKWFETRSRAKWIQVQSGEKWIQVLSGGCPNLTHLDLTSRCFWMANSVPAPPSLPALEELTLCATQNDEFWIFRNWQASNLPPSSKTGLSEFYRFNQHLPRFVSRLTNLQLIDCQNHHSVVHGLTFVELNDLEAPSLPAIVTNAAAPTLRDLQLWGFKLSESQAAALHRLQRLEVLVVSFEGRLPQSLLGLPQAFLHLNTLMLQGDFNQEFPRIGEGALPQLQEFHISSPDGSLEEGVTELVIGAASASFKLENLTTLDIRRVHLKLLPVEVFTSSKLERLIFGRCTSLEKLVLEPGVEHKIAGCSSLETLEFEKCHRMTVEGIPEVFKQMHRNRQLRIELNSKLMISFSFKVNLKRLNLCLFIGKML